MRGDLLVLVLGIWSIRFLRLCSPIHEQMIHKSRFFLMDWSKHSWLVNSFSDPLSVIFVLLRYKSLSNFVYCGIFSSFSLSYFS